MPTRRSASSASCSASASVLAPTKAPITTFSSTVMRGNERTTCQVRPMPRAQTACGLSPLIALPAKRIAPWSAARKPLMTLNSVVLPAPFGPMTP